MSAKKSLSFFELHLEKMLLGGAAAFAAYLLVTYLFLSPNTIDFDGPTAPREVHRKVLAKAQNLEQVVQRSDPNADPERWKVREFAAELMRRFNAGALGPADNGPQLPAELRPVVAFGAPMPKLPGGVASVESVTVVKPIAPTGLVTRTGRSLVQRAKVALPDPANPSAAQPVPPGGEGEGEELGWVTVGGYFSEKAQVAELSKANYPPYLAKVHLAGVALQRQELLPDGSYTAWQDVPAGSTLPPVEFPEATFDPKNGAPLNREIIERLFNQVRLGTALLVQPAFHERVAGDFWDIPLLEGYADLTTGEPEGGGAPPTPAAGGGLPPAPPGPREGDRPRPPPAGGGGGKGGVAPGAGGGGLPPQVPVPGGGAGPGAGARPTAPGDQLREDLREAQRALNKGDFATATTRATNVVNAATATRAQKTRAQKILDEIKEIQAQSQFTPLPLTRNPQGLVVNPDDDDALAVWFHDDTVLPGKTYRYRMAVRMWNRVVGRLNSVKDPAQARSSVLLGEWSLPSDPVTVAPSTYFFVASGPRPGGEPSLRLDVFKWRAGRWLREPFDVRVGDTIGGVKDVKNAGTDEAGEPIGGQVDFGTGAIVLEIREERGKARISAGKAGEFRYQEQPGWVLVYLDAADGQVKERALVSDRYNETYKRLRGGQAN